MSTKVLGKISTVLAVNAKPLQAGLNIAKGDLEKFASSVQSRIAGAGNSAKRALDGMYTDFQRLSRAVKAANSERLNLKVDNVKAILDVAKATERIAKPVVEAKRQFSSLSAEVQSALLPALVSAQKQSENLFDALSRGVKVTERDFANTEARINRVAESIRRATEASTATRGLASGQELRFQNPEFLRSTGRAAELQRQAAQLSPEAISGRGIVSLVGQQKLAADEAERLRGILERTIATRNGDQEAARRAYSQQVAYLDQVNDRLERQIQLEAQTNRRDAAEAEFVAESRRLRETAIAETQAREDALTQRRTAAEAEFVAESQRLREAAIAETQARENAVAARRAAAEAEFITENQRLREAAIAEVQAREDAAASRRLAAESEFLAESQRLREQAAADTQAREEAAAARRTAAESEFLAESQRLREQAASDARDREAVPLTGNRDPRTRVTNQLGQDIGDLRNRLRGVGDTLAGDIGPVVDNITTRFQNMARAGIGLAADQARQLAREVANINTALNSRQAIGRRFEESFGGPGSPGLSLGVDERSLRAIGSQIEYVQGRLSALGQEVRGPVITALDAFRTRAQQLFEGGAIDTEGGRRELQLLREELIRTLSAAGGGNERGIADALRRAGDVGRGGFDRFSLAIQQAAFAVDDFFSVTGGLDQRIRAVGNNISQLGFVLGGWQGLVAGIAASISAQLVVGIVKWYNAGISSESQTKAINEALSKQKTLVDQLAQSFESLADSLVQRAFSPATREAEGFAKSLRDIAKEQKELRIARFTLLDPTAFQQNTQANEFQKRLETTTDAGQTLALLRARARAQAAARGAAVDAAGRTANFDDAVNAIGARAANRAEATNQIFGNLLDALGSVVAPNPAASMNRTMGTNTGDARARFEVARGNRQDEVRVIEQRLNELEPLARQGTDSFLGFLSGQSGAAAAASREFARLTGILATLNNQLDSDNALIAFLKSVDQSTAVIAAAQGRASEAIAAGIPGAISLASSLDNLDREIQASADAIKEAERTLREAGDNPSIDQRERRDDVVRRETDRINRNRAARERALDRATALDRQRIVDPQNTFDAIQGRAEANLGESGLGSGRLARQLRELEARRREVEARLQREGGLANPFAARRAERDLAAIGQQAAAIEASTIALKKFTEYLTRAAQEAQNNLESARQREEQTRREDLGRSTPRSRGARQRAEADMRRQEELNNRVQDEVAKARARLEEQANDPANPLAGTFARAREIDQLLAAGGLSSQEQAKLIEERRRLQDRIDRAINQEQGVIDARDASTREAERQQSELRGRDLMLRPGQRAALELDQQIADIMEGAAGRRARDPLGRQAAQINQDEQEAIRRAREDAMRQQAPAIFGLADSVANALLQGPSRAALNPTDVSTVEGSRELTRLLRGDDAAKDQANLVELQKEANRLLDLIANNPANIAN